MGTVPNKVTLCEVWLLSQAAWVILEMDPWVRQGALWGGPAIVGHFVGQLAILQLVDVGVLPTGLTPR